MTLFTDVLKLQQKSIAMWFAVPQVISTRLWMLATANPLDTRNEQKEVHRMISEKQNAVIQSFQDVNSQILDSGQKLSSSWMNSWQSYLFGNNNAFEKLYQQVEQETVKILDKGISPYATAVKANNKRLNKL